MLEGIYFGTIMQYNCEFVPVFWVFYSKDLLTSRHVELACLLSFSRTTGLPITGALACPAISPPLKQPLSADDHCDHSQTMNVRHFKPKFSRRKKY